MNKTKFFALLAVSAMMFACGSQDSNGGPPELINGGRVTISPFDTLVAEFNSTIVNIDALEMEDLVPPLGTKREDYKTGNKLYFIGSYKTTEGGVPYFKPGMSNEPIEFPDIKNTDGYIQTKAVLYYSTYSILDSEPNNEESNASNINTLAPGAKFAGILDGSDEDCYEFMLRIGKDDVVEITIKSRDSMNVEFYRPDIANKKTMLLKDGTLKETIGSTYLIEGDVVGSKIPFYVKLYPEKYNSPPNPYTMSISREEKN